MAGVLEVTAFGAKGDGQHDDTAAFQEAIKAIDIQGGGELSVPAGTYQVGALTLCSHLVLTIQAGAKLAFIPEVNLYPVVQSRWEGVARPVYQACIYGKHLEDVTLQGMGVIDGNGQPWWDAFAKQDLAYPRPYLVSLEHCQHVRVRDLTFTNSPAWTLHPMESRDLVFDGVTVRNPADSPNTDGLDPESCNDIRIVNCEFDVGDDCIAVKAGTEQTAIKSPCENLVIANCNMRRGHGGVVLGSEMSGDIRHVVITNCTFDHTDRGIRMKTRRGRGGVIEDVTVSNIVMSHVLCPLVINSYYYCGPAGKEKYVWDKAAYPVDARTPQYRRLNFTNLIATDIQSCAGFIYGLPEAPIEDLQITNSQFFMAQSATPVEPAMIADAPKLSAAGWFIENTDRTRIQNVTIFDHQGAYCVNNTNNLNSAISEP
ncbi:glycoside hydrolase family 28 protein [Lacticaseibacillus jixiensis]|uniref:glycoside hydrolase family 28 protein n=1 Tax=Lacticaseibacillus jixiensis TaxID=3231926 RepID=UPI0036F2CEB0